MYALMNQPALIGGVTTPNAVVSASEGVHRHIPRGILIPSMNVANEGTVNVDTASIDTTAVNQPLHPVGLEPAEILGACHPARWFSHVPKCLCFVGFVIVVYLILWQLLW
jgi:hypothetical protein